ncbi:protein of unknown function [Candidatus Methylocalor cossyra]|uniref:Uncharacterized protein n=1 Tax=Candidatus Methylocalor cossyra TaxID=3108543 RepID=A0ABM9NJP8_9GAMM
MYRWSSGYPFQAHGRHPHKQAPCRSPDLSFSSNRIGIPPSPHPAFDRPGRRGFGRRSLLPLRPRPAALFQRFADQDAKGQAKGEIGQHIAQDFQQHPESPAFHPKATPALSPSQRVSPGRGNPTLPEGSQSSLSEGSVSDRPRTQKRPIAAMVSKPGDCFF